MIVQARQPVQASLAVRAVCRNGPLCLWRDHVGCWDRELTGIDCQALALGRRDAASCQRVKWGNSGAIFMSAKRPPISIATNAVMSAIVSSLDFFWWLIVF